MAWLLTHMWMALAGVGLFSLLFGWSMRGILLVGKLRTARVDRDIARTELEQAKAEIEGLYAAQRNAVPGASAPAAATDPALRAELNVREKRLSELSAELSRSKAELQALKSGAGRGAAPVAPKMASDQTEPTLLWRNRHLESRVQHLEAALHEQASAPVQAVAAPAVAAAVSPEPAVDTAELDKLKWQADFFKQRVETLEAELAAQPAPAPAAEPVAAPIESDDAGEELARLRWRNRFLEGRLAYFEGDAAPEDAAAPDVAELVDLEVEEVEADETLEDDEEVISATDAILQELEEADAAADAEEEGEFDEEVDEPEDDMADEIEDALEAEDEADELEDDDLEDEALEDGDEDEGDEDALDEDEDEDPELEDDADIDAEDEDEAEADEESDDETEDDDAYDEESDEEDLDVEDEDDLESDDEEDEDVLEDDESDEDESEDDESDEDDEDDEVEEDEVEDDDTEDDDADESDDEEDFDEDDEAVDEDALDEADEADAGDYDEESNDDADEELDDEDDEGAEANAIPAERPIALPKAVADSPDDLTIIGGIGPKIQEVLNELGIFHYDQIAAWTPANIAWVDNHLNFSGRISREGWVEQAAILSGDVAEE